MAVEAAVAAVAVGGQGADVGGRLGGRCVEDGEDCRQFGCEGETIWYQVNLVVLG